MKKALVFNNIVHQVVEHGNEFVVHETMAWVECPDNVTTEWSFKDGVFVPPVTEQDLPYDLHRRNNYPAIQDQLDILYHEGIEGWKAMIDEIKQKYPKPEVN